MVSLLARPRTRGVKCVVRHDGRVLLVRHAYGPRVWDLPGGFARRGEDFADAARRELSEELAIADVTAVTSAGELHRRHMGRRETIGAVVVDVPGPGVSLPGFELTRAGWFAPGELPALRSEVIDEVLAHVGGLWPSAEG